LRHGQEASLKERNSATLPVWNILFAAAKYARMTASTWASTGVGVGVDAVLDSVGLGVGIVPGFSGSSEHPAAPSARTAITNDRSSTDPVPVPMTARA
jgi:hypothetical protein